MATPTPTTWTRWDGTRGCAYWDAVWITTDNFTDEVVIDISTLGAPTPSAIKIKGVYASLNGDITATLEFDATTDEHIYTFRGQTDGSLREGLDFSELPSSGFNATKTAAGFVGDLLLTTTNVASGDELTLLVLFEKS